MAAPPAVPDVTLRRARLLIGGEWVDGTETFAVARQVHRRGHRPRRSRRRASRSTPPSPPRTDSFLATRLDASERYASCAGARRPDRAAPRRAGARRSPPRPASRSPTRRNEVTRAIQTLPDRGRGRQAAGRRSGADRGGARATRIAWRSRFACRAAWSAASPRSTRRSTSSPTRRRRRSRPATPSCSRRRRRRRSAPRCCARSCSRPASRRRTSTWCRGRAARWAAGWSRTRRSASTPSPAAPRVGKQLQRDVGLRPIALELGSIAATLVCADGDLDRAAPRIANSAFRRAGQACTSTQRLFVQRRVRRRRSSRSSRPRTAPLKVGDPRDPETVVGPMISEAEAARAEQWIARRGRRRRAARRRRHAARRAADADDPDRRRPRHAGRCARRSSRRSCR